MFGIKILPLVFVKVALVRRMSIGGIPNSSINSYKACLSIELYAC